MGALDPTLTCDGRSSPFFVGCHSFAIAGALFASDRARVTFLPAQIGHPLRCCTREAMATHHSCDGSRAQRHHTLRDEPEGTSHAERALRASCHSAAISGSSAPSEFVRETRRFLQNGQPDRSRVRSRSELAQTCSSPPGHFHHTIRVEPATMRSGVSAPFRVGCHSEAILRGAGREVVRHRDAPPRAERAAGAKRRPSVRGRDPFVVWPRRALPPDVRGRTVRDLAGRQLAVPRRVPLGDEVRITGHPVRAHPATGDDPSGGADGGK